MAKKSDKDAERKLVIRHRSGSKQGHVEEFELAGLGDVVFGRDPSATVTFDPDRDDLVSRQHAKIVTPAADDGPFELVDLESSNGTFLNKQRLSDKRALRPGDVIQLGPGGPELEFDLDPRPASEAPKTRLAAAAAPPTREAAGAKPATVGKETVERMIVQSKASSKRTTMTIAAVVLALVALAVIYAVYQGRKGIQQVRDETTTVIEGLRAGEPLDPAVIASTFDGATVLIEIGWKLVYTENGSQLYHRTIKEMPAYFYTGQSIEPWLHADSENGTNIAIGGMGTGSGFVVHEDGFILTNRHVAAPWHTRYGLQKFGFPGRLFDPESGKEIGTIGFQGNSLVLETSEGTQRLDPGLLGRLQRWVPSKAIYLGDQIIQGKLLEGRLDYLDVTFPGTRTRIPARLVRTSDTADAALIKIDVPQKVTTVQLYDSYEEVQPGDRITVMGYPGLSPDVAVRVDSVDTFNPESGWVTVPDPTVTVGGIGRLIRGQELAAAAGSDAYWSMAGDLYQLTINATGSGNSGGPVFDDYGRVIAIYSMGMQGGGAAMSGAVPIRYGLELMNIN